jgi:rhodanese-related sulfurtransferase
MKYFTLLFAAIFSLACNSNSQPKETGVEQVQTGTLSSTEFEQRMKDPNVQILDVRTAAEYKNAHLKNALQANWMDRAQFEDRTQYLDKNRPVLLYCASGIRSAQAMEELAQKGFKQLYNLKGGIALWKMDNKPLIAQEAVAELSLAAFESMVKGTKVALVDIGAEWCPPCVKMEPVLQQLQKDLPNAYSLIKVDGGNDVTVMKALKFESLPTFIVFKNGKETWRKQGIVSIEELKAAIGK